MGQDPVIRETLFKDIYNNQLISSLNIHMLNQTLQGKFKLEHTHCQTLALWEISIFLNKDNLILIQLDR